MERLRHWQGDEDFSVAAPPEPPPGGGGGGGQPSGGGGGEGQPQPSPGPGQQGDNPLNPGDGQPQNRPQQKDDAPPYDAPDAKQVWPPVDDNPEPKQDPNGEPRSDGENQQSNRSNDSDDSSQQQGGPNGDQPEGGEPNPGDSQQGGQPGSRPTPDKVEGTTNLDNLVNEVINELLGKSAAPAIDKPTGANAVPTKPRRENRAKQQRQLAPDPSIVHTWPPKQQKKDKSVPQQSSGADAHFEDGRKFDQKLDDLDAWLKQTVGKASFFENAFGAGKQKAKKLREQIGDPQGLFAPSAEESGDRDLNESVVEALSVMHSVGTAYGGPVVPIKPVSIPQKRAITVAQAMIDRLSNEESDEVALDNVFEFDASLLMQLKINPMRGLHSAMVGRSRDPVALYVDFSGSCNHVAELFGLIMTGFAHEGGTILVGGNEAVHYVYQPLLNRPLQYYAEDLNKLAQMSTYGEVRTRGGYTINVGNTELSSYRLGALIACTDNHAYDQLIRMPKNTVHIIYAEGEEEQVPYRRWFWGKYLRSSNVQAIQKATGGGIGDSEVSEMINLCLEQNLWLVNDLESLTEAMARAN